MQFNPKTHKPVIVIAGIVLAVGGLRYAATHGILPSNIGKIIAPQKFDLPSLADAAIPNVKPAPYPSSTPANVPSPLIRAEIWEWNAQAGWILANGGNATTKGSLNEKYGVNLLLTRQDDTNKMVEDLIACAKQIHDGSDTCSSGANIVDIMGDQFAEVAAQANPQLLKLGPDYGVIEIGAVGYSRGEDACMLPQNMQDNPRSMAQTPADPTQDSKPQGVLIAASVREGDWNICQKWEGDNALPNNPDPKTFDANAINWLEEQDYNTAAADYVAGKCDDRKEVKAGKLTGATVHVCINGVATWTPGDVTVATKRGGLVKVADSLMYRSQMPSVIIGSKHFLYAHRQEVQSMLRAAWDGADQIKAFDAALDKATEIETRVYGDDGGDPRFHGGAYWKYYFHPVRKRDAAGHTVSLGGSAVANLADNAVLYGLNGNNNNAVAVYNIFKLINLQQYPNLFRADGPTPLPDVKMVIDRSFVEVAEAGNDQPQAQADTVDYAKAGSGDVVSHRSYSINFATGSAQPLPEGEQTLAELKDSIAITGLKVKVDGYTDDTGSASTNTSLSAARAAEVKAWLQQHARGNFPDARFISVEGHGPANPIASNSTAEGKAQNRRVEITLEN